MNMAPPEIELSKNIETKADGCKPSVLSELLCCPFCGGKAFTWRLFGGWKVSCENDCITMPPRYEVSFTSEENAKRKWNHRAT